jgi:hypothetical protein
MMFKVLSSIRIAIYNHNMFIVQATGVAVIKHFFVVNLSLMKRTQKTEGFVPSKCD